MEKYAKMGGGGNLTLGGRETGVRRLMTTNLLKRLESSVCSFRLTLERVLAAMNAALKTIDDYRSGLATGASVADGDLPGGFDFDPDDESGFEVGGATKILVEDMDWMSWERDIEADVAVIEVLISMVRDIDPAHDAKLIELCEQIRGKSQGPINPGNRILRHGGLPLRERVCLREARARPRVREGDR